MLTSRRYGGWPVTSLSATTIGPRSGSSKPPIIRSVVVLPQPGRAEQREERAARDLEAEVVDRDDVVEALRHALEADVHGPADRAGVLDRSHLAITPA